MLAPPHTYGVPRMASAEVNAVVAAGDGPTLAGAVEGGLRLVGVGGAAGTLPVAGIVGAVLEPVVGEGVLVVGTAPVAGEVTVSEAGVGFMAGPVEGTGVGVVGVKMVPWLVPKTVCGDFKPSSGIEL